MKQITTGRLQLIPLDLPQLQLLCHRPEELYRNLNLTPEQLQIEPPEFAQMFDEALQSQVLPAVARHRSDYLWYTHWLAVLQLEMRVIGGIGISGLPDDSGTCEIGYYVDRRYQRSGYATEALAGLLDWMKGYPDLRKVIAHTPEELVHSQKVLQKNGFRRNGFAEPGIVQWVLDIPVTSNV